MSSTTIRSPVDGVTTFNDSTQVDATVFRADNVILRSDDKRVRVPTSPPTAAGEKLMITSSGDPQTLEWQFTPAVTAGMSANQAFASSTGRIIFDTAVSTTSMYDTGTGVFSLTQDEPYLITACIAVTSLSTSTTIEMRTSAGSSIGSPIIRGESIQQGASVSFSSGSSFSFVFTPSSVAESSVALDVTGAGESAFSIFAGSHCTVVRLR